MFETVMEAFEAWMAARESGRSYREAYPKGSYYPGSPAEATHRRLDEAEDGAREAYMRAMDAWFEWKRLNGPQHPGGGP